jgi:hypothetical protein
VPLQRGLLVILEVYADESGIHDLIKGQQPNSAVPVVGGYINTPQNWAKFSHQWQAILDKYKVKRFHFSEYKARNRDPQNGSNPYRHLNDVELEDMLYELAIEAGNTSVPVAGMYHVKKHYATAAQGDPATELWVAFFNSFWEQIIVHWPGFSDQVSFVFHHTTNDDWALTINRVFCTALTKDPRISSWKFASDEKLLPLQAADLLVGVTQQAAVPYMENNKETPEWRILDAALGKNNLPNQFDHLVWQIGIHAMIADMREQRAEADAAGLPRKRYFPRIHHPLLKSGLFWPKRGCCESRSVKH